MEFEEIDPLENDHTEKHPEFRFLRRGEDEIGPVAMNEFGWFLHEVGDLETYNVWREAAGLPPADLRNDVEAFKETLDLGPPKHPLVIRYRDPTGERTFETEYTWFVDRGGDEMVLEYVGWRETPT